MDAADSVPAQLHSQVEIWVGLGYKTLVHLRTGTPVKFAVEKLYTP